VDYSTEGATLQVSTKNSITSAYDITNYNEHRNFDGHYLRTEMILSYDWL